MTDSPSAPPGAASVPDNPANPAPAIQPISMDDFDALNRVVCQALGICDAVQTSAEIDEQHASALWAAVDLLQLGRAILQRYAVATSRRA